MLDATAALTLLAVLAGEPRSAGQSAQRAATANLAGQSAQRAATANLAGQSAQRAATANLAGRVREPSVHPTWGWLAAQLIPSPGLAIGTERAALDLRWQLTPVLYSFGIDRRLSPWRFFVAEPIVRQSGSLELYVSPEYLGVAEALEDRFGFRIGTRAYFPVAHRGEYLSVSVGSSYYRFPFHEGASYEGGVHVLFGMLGFLAVLSPGFNDAVVTTTLALRFF